MVFILEPDSSPFAIYVLCHAGERWLVLSLAVTPVAPKSLEGTKLVSREYVVKSLSYFIAYASGVSGLI